MLDLFKDHKGKISQGRVSALAGMGIAGGLATAPLWGGPDPSIEMVVAFIVGPGGMALWQKGTAEKPREQEKASE